MSNPGKIMDAHYRIQRESAVCVATPMRNCQGECRKRRSHTQFAPGSSVCMRCARRTA